VKPFGERLIGPAEKSFKVSFHILYHVLQRVFH
jgi:hypothetical protein